MTLRELIAELVKYPYPDQKITCIRIGVGKNLCSTLFPDAAMKVELEADFMTPIGNPDTLEITFNA